MNIKNTKLELNKPVLVGFFPKLTANKQKWMKNQRVKEICSVSTHISEGPKDWMSKLQHNKYGFYNSEIKALSILAGESERYDLYAYTLYPYLFEDGVVNQVDNSFCVSMELDKFRFLGYDVANQSVDDIFDCSALSCNSGADDFTVNRYCLFQTTEEAYAAALIISRGGYEPGPWFILGVYRKSKKIIKTKFV